MPRRPIPAGTRGGIYRNVWLREQGDVRLPLWGQHVEPYEVDASSAHMRVATTVENVGKREVRAQIALTLVAPDGQRVAIARRGIEIPAGTSEINTDTLSVLLPSYGAPTRLPSTGSIPK